MVKQLAEKRDNGVKGIVMQNAEDPSPGRVSHVGQMTPDHQPATVRRNTNCRIATWNVQTLYQAGKLENVRREMQRLHINILGLCETRWTEAGSFTLEDGSFMIFSGGSEHKHGVGMILDKETARCIIGFWPISDRVLLVKIKNKPFDIDIIQVYAPTCDHSEEDMEKF